MDEILKLCSGRWIIAHYEDGRWYARTTEDIYQRGNGPHTVYANDPERLAASTPLYRSRAAALERLNA